MADIVEDFLKAHGPCLSGEVAQHLIGSVGVSAVAARKRVSRVSGEVRRLGYITFPRKARFMYLQQQFGSPVYWQNLVRALLETNSAYGLAIAALRQRGGLIPAKHFSIACGAPVKQARHLSPDTILKRLSEAGLVQKSDVPGLGDCVLPIQHPEYYDDKAADVRVRLITEDFLLTAIRDWLRKLGIVSYDKVTTRDAESLPMVGTFAWDLTAPSYLGFMVKSGKDRTLKPGFVACDVFLGETVTADCIRPFINKCKTLRSLQKVGACMQIFVASNYDSTAFQLLKENGIIPATPNHLFGEEVAQGLIGLSAVLKKAAITAIDPAEFDGLFKKFGKIEGAATQLRGTLFEYLVADVARKTMSTDIKMNRIFKSDDDKKAEADVIAIKEGLSITFIECKGYSPYGEVPDAYVERWLQHNVPIFYKETRKHPDWKNLKVHFEFWVTGTLSGAALSMIETAKKKINPNRYTIDLRLGPQILKICQSTNDEGLSTAFKKHFMKFDSNATTPQETVFGAGASNLSN